LNNNAA
jgi:hypothetical protein